VFRKRLPEGPQNCYNCDRIKRYLRLSRNIDPCARIHCGRTLKQHPQRDFNNFRRKTPESKHFPWLSECIRSGGHWCVFVRLSTGKYHSESSSRFLQRPLNLPRLVYYLTLAECRTGANRPSRKKNYRIIYASLKLLRGGAGKSLTRPTCRCRTESIVSLEREVCSCAELQVFSCYRG